MLLSSKQKDCIQGSSGCNSWSEYGEEIEFDKNESDIFGLLFLGDGATVSIIPLLNILFSIKIFQYLY